jgi:hypothetical protein
MRFLHLARLREIYVEEAEDRILKIDTGLLSVLIEFLRLETHTIHFNYCEMTVTLDVNSQILLRCHQFFSAIACMLCAGSILSFSSNRTI